MLFLVSIGLAQASWSESTVVFLHSLIIYSTTTIIFNHRTSYRRSWFKPIFVISTCCALATLTRMVPIFFVPALYFVLHSIFSANERLFYWVSALVLVSFVLIVSAYSNMYRFDRFELTSSSGRHLWQGVNSIVSSENSDDPKLSALFAANPKLVNMNWWEIRLPGRDLPNTSIKNFQDIEMEWHEYQLERDRYLKYIAIMMIKDNPIEYIKSGINKFSKTVGKIPGRIGYGKGPSNPLDRYVLLPPIAVSVFGSQSAALAAYTQTLCRAYYRMVLRIYPIVIFLIAFKTISILFRKAINIRQSDRDPVRENVESLYVFLSGLLFFSLLFSWTVELENPRNVIPYFPIIAILFSITLHSITNISK